jgi:hypothetical protein
LFLFGLFISLCLSDGRVDDVSLFFDLVCVENKNKKTKEQKAAQAEKEAKARKQQGLWGGLLRCCVNNRSFTRQPHHNDRSFLYLPLLLCVLLLLCVCVCVVVPCLRFVSLVRSESIAWHRICHYVLRLVYIAYILLKRRPNYFTHFLLARGNAALGCLEEGRARAAQKEVRYSGG